MEIEEDDKEGCEDKIYRGGDGGSILLLFSFNFSAVTCVVRLFVPAG